MRDYIQKVEGTYTGAQVGDNEWKYSQSPMFNRVNI